MHHPSLPRRATHFHGPYVLVSQNVLLQQSADVVHDEPAGWFGLLGGITGVTALHSY